MGHKDTLSNKPRLVVQYDDHSSFMATVLCTLMEHQSLVDIAIRCGNQTLHAHKVILASNSPYFREQLENNQDTEQIIVNGMDFCTLKSIIEFMYCGETSIAEENVKYIVAAAKLFQVRGLQAIAPEAPDGDEVIYYPPPIFINQKPKYSSPYASSYSPISGQPKNKLHAEGTSDYQVNGSEEFMAELQSHPLQVASFNDLNAPIIDSDERSMDMFSMGYTGEKPIDEIEEVFPREMEESLQIMYKTPDGEYVQVSNYDEDPIRFDIMDGDISRQIGSEELTRTSSTNLRVLDNEELSPNFENEDALDGFTRNEHDNYHDNPYYRDENYQDATVDPSIQTGINLLLHFQSQNRNPHGLHELNTEEPALGGNIDNDLDQEPGNTIMINKDTTFIDVSELDQHIQDSTSDNQGLLHQIGSLQFYNNTDQEDYDNEALKIADDYSHHEDSDAIPENELLMQPEYNKDVDVSVIDVEPLATGNHIPVEVTNLNPEVGEIVDYIMPGKPPTIYSK